jgi:hypothetical protein
MRLFSYLPWRVSLTESLSSSKLMAQVKLRIVASEALFKEEEWFAYVKKNN